MGLPGLPGSDMPVRAADIQNNHRRRRKPRGLHADIRILPVVLPVYAPVHQHRNDHRPDAGNRHPSAAAQLRRLIALGLLDSDIHLRGPQQSGEKIFLKDLVSLCVPTSLGGEMVDTRDLKSLGQKCPCGFDSRPRHLKKS